MGFNGQIPWNKGIKIPFKKRVPLSEETKNKISKSNRGKPSWIKGLHQTEETKEKMSLSHRLSAKRGKDSANYGKKFSEKTRKRISESLKGKNAGNKNGSWRGGKTPENKKIRSSTEYFLWRSAVFKRDNFTCQKCNFSGGRIVAHHINNFADFPELRTAISNGIVLCKDCHICFHKKYGIRNNTMEQIQNFIKC